ncbi:MAG: 50S ribosomal protein L17 [Elusimicrobia bacterium]|nr:50S ribosomal protein L17 [Elusimicrobiota bacterium]
MKTFAGRKLSRTSSHRQALLRRLATDLFLHERVRTTLPRAKEVARFAERLLSRARTGDLVAHRRVARVISEPQVQQKLFTVLIPRYKDRPGGFTRVVRLGPRPSDQAPLGLVQLV